MILPAVSGISRRGVLVGTLGAAAVPPLSVEQPTPRDLATEIRRAMASGRYVAGIGNSYWGHPQNGIFLPPGTYDAGSLSLVGNDAPFPALSLVAMPGTVVIRVPDDRYLFEAPGRLNRLFLYGLTIVGGRGALHQTHTGNNVNGFFEFQQCVFDNYSECAIGNAAGDQPYLRVRDCTFMAAPGSSAVGIAWGGYADGTIIEGNAFLRNRYHLKLGPGFSGSAHILRNDFLRWDQDTPFIAAIWLVPQDQPNSFGTNAGQGTIIAGNKFGNENLGNDDVRILVAREVTGDDRPSRSHAARWVEGGTSGAYLTGITVSDSRISCNAHTRSPFMRSYIAEVRNFSYANNRHDGGGHSYLCQFMGRRQGDYANLNWSVDLGAADTALFGSPWAIAIANAPIGPIHDPSGALAIEEEALLFPTGGDESSFSLLGKADTADGFQAYQGSTSVSVADALGSRRAAMVRVPAANVGVAVPLAGVAAGRLSWAALDLKQAESASVRAIRIHIRNYRLGVDAKVFRYVLPPEWRRVRIPFTFPADASADAWQLIVAADDHDPQGDSFAVARAYVYHGREPVRDGHLRTLGDGKWDGGHLVMGTTHLWEDDGKLYVRTGGAPRSATDGVAITARPT